MEIIEELQEIFRGIFDDEELVISRDTTAEDIEDWDSLTHMQLITEIEKKFGIKFTTDEIVKASDLGEFIDIIEKKL